MLARDIPGDLTQASNLTLNYCGLNDLAIKRHSQVGTNILLRELAETTNRIPLHLKENIRPTRLVGTNADL